MLIDLIMGQLVTRHQQINNNTPDVQVLYRDWGKRVKGGGRGPVLYGHYYYYVSDKYLPTSDTYTVDCNDEYDPADMEETSDHMKTRRSTPTMV